MNRERDLPLWLAMLLLVLCFAVVGYVEAVMPLHPAQDASTALSDRSSQP